jgi:ABC-type enterobactin transport system permease subunit
MGAGIAWIMLGFVYYFIYKHGQDYYYKINSNTFFVIGVVAFIISFINRTFFRSAALELCIISILIPAFIYIARKTKQYNIGLKIADKLTEK